MTAVRRREFAFTRMVRSKCYAGAIVGSEAIALGNEWAVLVYRLLLEIETLEDASIIRTLPFR